MTVISKRTRLGQAILIALVAAASAHAEDATSPQPNSSTELGTVVVTAEKRSEDVQKVPISVSVVDEAQLESLHVTQISDLVGYIPGLTVTNNGSPGQASLGLRGVAPLSAGSTVATYIDETPIGTSSNYGGGSTNILDLLPYDFQSVEVLRGPQGTLYGASALGGVVRYVTKSPDLNTASLHAGADFFDQSGAGDLGFYARAGISTPIVADKLAVSVSVARQNSPGYTDNVRTGEKDQDSFWQGAAHATVLWKPSDDLSVKFSALQSKIDADSASVTAIDPATLKPIYGDLKNDNYVPEPYQRTNSYYNATVNWNLGWSDFVSTTSYAETSQHNGLDGSLVYGILFPLFGLKSAGVSNVTYDLQLYKTTQEFRLASKPDDHLEWLVGMFYTRETSEQAQGASAQTFSLASIPGLDPLAVISLPSTYKEYAGFGDLTWKFNSSFDITGGLRWAHNDQTFSQITSGALTGSTNVPGASSEDVVTYSLSPRFHLSPDSMLYVRIASGYQPGGPNLSLPGVPTSVDASTLTSYEAGIKSLLLDHSLVVDAAIYDVEWDKIQVSAVTNGLQYLANGGSARSRGLEFSTQWMPVPGLHLGLNGAYTDAVLTEDVASIGGKDGDRLPNIPKFSASATADYTFPIGEGWSARFGGGLRYVGSTDSELAHSATVLPQDSYTVLDLNADFSNDRWTVRVFAKNATDERVYTNLGALTSPLDGSITRVRGVPLAPRTIGVGFDLKF